MGTRRREFTWIEGLAFCLAAIAIQLTSEATAQWGTYFYSPSDTGRRVIYIGIHLVWLVFVTGRLIDGLTDPLIGTWSDNTSTRRKRPWFFGPRGRRRPYIFWGSILMTFSFIAMWFPPVEGESLTNFFYALFIVSLHWVLWTICVIPLNSLLPEIARSQSGRVKLGTWYAVGLILGLALVEIAVPAMVDNLDPARQIEGAERFSPLGYQRTAVILATVALLFFQFLVWVVRERHQTTVEEQEPRPAFGEIGSALKNRVCLMFIAAFFFQSVAVLAVQKALPYWVELGLEGDEQTVALCMGPFILMTLVTYAFVPALARRFPVKWLMFASVAIFTSGFPMMHVIGALDWDPATKTILAGTLFGWCGIGQGLFYVLLPVMLGEIIDLDEKHTGRRREAVYWGLQGVAIKLGQALSVLVATQVMNAFGHSTERPLGAFLVGPISGLFAIVALVVLWYYPILHVTKKTPEAVLTQTPPESAERQ